MIKATTKDKGKTCAKCGHVIYIIRKEPRCMCDNPHVYEGQKKVEWKES